MCWVAGIGHVQLDQSYEAIYSIFSLAFSRQKYHLRKKKPIVENLTITLHQNHTTHQYLLLGRYEAINNRETYIKTHTRTSC